MVVFAIYPLGETRVQREAEALVKNGYEVDVICVSLPGQSVIDEYKGVKIYREKVQLPFILRRGHGLTGKFLYYLLFFLLAAFRLTKLNLKKRYATIQVHNLPDFLVFTALLPKLMRIPVILDLHDLMPEFYSGRYGSDKSFLSWLIRKQESLACRFADHVITVSDHWRKALIERGVPEKKCSVVMNVADESIFHRSQQARNDTSDKDGFRLIYHGTIVERYGLDLAIQAVEKVRREIPGIRLTLVGYGEDLPHLKMMVDTLNLGEIVNFEKLTLAEDLPNLIQSCDLGIVPYRNDIFTDGLLPTKLMEYATLEMPVIAARTTAIQAYFRGANVEFFEPGNVDDLARCILTLYNNPERMAELARGAEKFNQRYNWAQISKAYVSLVARLGGVDFGNTGSESSGSIPSN